MADLADALARVTEAGSGTSALPFNTDIVRTAWESRVRALRQAKRAARAAAQAALPDGTDSSLIQTDDDDPMSYSYVYQLWTDHIIVSVDGPGAGSSWLSVPFTVKPPGASADDVEFGTPVPVKQTYVAATALALSSSDRTPSGAVKQSKRDRAHKNNHSLDDGSFPIENVSDLNNAIQSLGRAKDRGAAVRLIKRRARELGVPEKAKNISEGKDNKVAASSPSSLDRIVAAAAGRSAEEGMIAMSAPPWASKKPGSASSTPKASNSSSSGMVQGHKLVSDPTTPTSTQAIHTSAGKKVGAVKQTGNSFTHSGDNHSQKFGSAQHALRGFVAQKSSSGSSGGQNLGGGSGSSSSGGGGGGQNLGGGSGGSSSGGQNLGGGSGSSDSGNSDNKKNKKKNPFA